MENKPLDNLQQLMAITAEECAELSQVCMKVLRFGMNDEGVPKQKWIIEEAGDVLCMLELMSEHGLFDWEQIYQRADVKREKLKKWSTLIQEDDDVYTHGMSTPGDITHD